VAELRNFRVLGEIGVEDTDHWWSYFYSSRPHL